MLSYMYREVYQGDLFYQKENIQAFFRYVLGEIYAERIDVRNIYNDDDFGKMVNGTILNDEYDDVLTLIEGIIQHWDEYYSGLVFKTNYLSFYNESMLRRERKPLPHSNQCYAA